MPDLAATFLQEKLNLILMHSILSRTAKSDCRLNADILRQLTIHGIPHQIRGCGTSFGKEEKFKIRSSWQGGGPILTRRTRRRKCGRNCESPSQTSIGTQWNWSWRGTISKHLRGKSTGFVVKTWKRCSSKCLTRPHCIASNYSHIFAQGRGCSVGQLANQGSFR